MAARITLISHALCPYVQRIAIALTEKAVPHDRRFVELTDKPGWFLELSPLGRTPVLKVDDAALFESGAILEFLEDTLPRPLHPVNPVERARHRAWIGFGAECLNDISGFYSAEDTEKLNQKAAALHVRFRTLEQQLGNGPWFAGERFSIVDAVYAPVFRYFDVFDQIGAFGVFDGLPKVSDWRQALAERPSVRDAVAWDYNLRLFAFLYRRGGALASLLQNSGAGYRRSA